MKAVKTRRESVEAYTAAARPDLAAAEEAEIAILSSYLPAQLSESDIDTLVAEAIAATGATSAKEMGKVMGWLAPKTKGKVDGKVNQLMGLGPTPADASQLPSTDIARRAQLTSQTLADVVSSMASISNRRKVIVLVSSGAVLNTLTANERRELQATFAAVAASASWPMSTSPPS